MFKDWIEAIRFCEKHKCKECPAYNHEYRTKQQIENFVPCFANLVDKSLWYKEWEEWTKE